MWWVLGHQKHGGPGGSQHENRSRGRGLALTHGGYGVDHAVGDLVLPHVLDHIELRRPLLGDDLVGDLLQLGVELLEQVFKQQGEQLGEEEEEEEAGRERETNSVNIELRTWGK